MIKSFVTITILTLLWIRNVDKYYEKTNYKKIKEREREKKLKPLSRSGIEPEISWFRVSRVNH